MRTTCTLPSNRAGLDLLESADDTLLLSVLLEVATLGNGLDLKPTDKEGYPLHHLDKVYDT